ncbi:uncharacterized protein V6R79_009924 [Siganus canaliculatus]
MWTAEGLSQQHVLERCDRAVTVTVTVDGDFGCRRKKPSEARLRLASHCQETGRRLSCVFRSEEVRWFRTCAATRPKEAEFSQSGADCYGGPIFG